MGTSSIRDYFSVGVEKVRFLSASFVPSGLTVVEMRYPELSVRPELDNRYIPSYFYSTLFEEAGIDLINFKPVDLSLLQVDID